MEFTASKVTGTPEASTWTQVHDFIPQDDKKIASRGRLIAIISAAVSTEEEAVVIIGREVLTRLHEEYYGDISGSSYLALKKAVETVEKEFGENLARLEISATSFVGENIFTSAVGGGKLYIYRDGKLVKLLASTDQETISASGKVNIGDIFILTSSGIFNLISQEELSEFLTIKSLNETLDSITSMIHSSPGSGTIGVVFVEAVDEEGLAENLPGEPQEKDYGEDKRPKRTFDFRASFENFKNRIVGRDLYIHRGEVSVESVQRKKVTFSVGLILLLLLSVSIFFGVMQKREKDIRESYQSKLLQAQHDYDEALELLSLNPERARELFAKSRKEAGDLKNKGVDDPELNLLIGKIEESEGSVLGEYNIDFDLFVDLSLLSDGFTAEKLSEDGGEIYILDTKNSRVANVSVSSKNAQIVAGPGQADDSIDLTSYSGRVFLLKDDGIYELTEGRNKVIDRDWEGDVLLQAYAGNIYLLEKYGTIARFSGTDNGFSERRDWVTDGLEVNFTDAIDWSIDGSIWILTESGGIEKYTSGNPQVFKVVGTAPELEKPISIFTNDQLEYIYILDPENRRIVVITKEGDFKAQYLSDIFSESENFAVSETEKKIIILSQNKLFSAELKHFK